MANKDENDAISALTGFSISHVLGDLSLPSGSSLTNRLGISGLPSLNADQIYSEKWEEDDEAVGPEQGQDWEDEIDREMREEGDEGVSVKQEAMSPGVRKKEKRTRVVKRLVERPKSVYERFPAFEKDRVLDFSELFKGYTVRKSRLSKRPYQSELSTYCLAEDADMQKVETVYPRKHDHMKGFLNAVVGDAKRQVENQRVEEEVSAGNIELDLRKALEVRLNSLVL